ncbi:hypothetical protein COV17_00945 [Candidatus Woesearchaeota archaeon CG10_big_fil_rev_8_21_14_0_10_36_11]|nr:MAG: hypothetical protein COV17_00945 [Candidatus Woesearchaeota archaeon CG10_big_fil_rev_8_21_14_0_10_36_11]
MVWTLILKSLYFFLPAYIANMAPVLFKWVPFLNKSIHTRLLGKNKTWRGLIIAPLMGMLIFWLQKIAFTAGFTQFALIDYAGFSILLGFLLGLGAIVGDLVESYYKRKAGIRPGEKWIPFDQLDFVIGGILFSFFAYVPKAEVVLVLVVVSPLLHIAVNHIGYWLGINKSKF